MRGSCQCWLPPSQPTMFGNAYATPPQLLASSVHYRWKHSIVLSEIEFHRHANRQQESAIYNTWTKKHPVKHVRTCTGASNSHCTHSRHLPHFKNSSGIEPPHPQTALPQKYMRQLQPCTPTYTIECPYTAGSPADVWAGHYCIHTQYMNAHWYVLRIKLQMYA